MVQQDNSNAKKIDTQAIEKLGGKSNDEFVDEIMEKAGGLGRFQIVVVYLGIGTGMNGVFAWLYYQVPYLI